MKNIVLPALYDASKSGKTKLWTIGLESRGETWVIVTTHGYVGGKMQRTEEFVLEGKNIGRANETSAYEQAYSQAESQWTKKKKKGYVETINKATTKKVERLPMLAKKYEDAAHKIKFPCYVEPKLNGNRCTITKEDGKIVMRSRNGEVLKAAAHIAKAFENAIGEGDYVDGELYIHGEALQSIASAVKKVGPLTEKLEYHFYDFVPAELPDLNMVGRELLMDKLQQKLGDDRVKKLQREVAQTEAEIRAQHHFYTKMGYEGTMIRNLEASYTFKHRSNDLQKYKDFQDEEFKVIGCKSGTPGSKFDGCAIFQCETPNGGTFDVVCEGTIPEKKEQYKNRAKYMGKLLTVRFQEYTKDMIPLFPVGVAFRETWDM